MKREASLNAPKPGAPVWEFDRNREAALDPAASITALGFFAPRDAGSASADAAAGSSRKAWGRPLRVTLVGEGGAEAGLCLWECVCEDDDDASFADAAFADADEDLHLERGRSARDARSEKSDREWLRRGADAPAPGAVLAMDGRAARELSLRGGSRVSVFPPWNEVEVPPSVATGFKRRRVVVGTLVAV